MPRDLDKPGMLGLIFCMLDEPLMFVCALQNEVHVSGMEVHIYRWQRISSTLIETKNIHTVTIPLPRCSEETVQKLKRCSSLRLIRIVDTDSISEVGSAELARRRAFQNFVDSDQRLQELVMFETSRS